VAEPIRIDGRRPPVRLPPPLLGEHTDEVLAELDDDPT
jgi:crotonobetainyl-CoA:carnitine CoA-transferase CaiB-like acyl-CoA transferase